MYQFVYKFRIFKRMNRNQRDEKLFKLNVGNTTIVYLYVLRDLLKQ